MDIDRYTQRHDPTWRRLQQLADQARSTRRRVDDDEIAELVSLYQRVSAQLSHARTTYADPALNARLSQLLGEARVVIYRTRSNPARAVATLREHDALERCVVVVAAGEDPAGLQYVAPYAATTIADVVARASASRASRTRSVSSRNNASSVAVVAVATTSR